MQGPVAVAPRRDGEESSLSLPEIILFHEYAHHFMMQYAPASYPAWYIEGFAEIASTAATMPGGRMAWGKPAEIRQYSLDVSRWVPVRILLSQTYASFPDGADFYGQSWLLAHYLTFSQERAGQLRRYLALLGAGRAQADAAVEAFGDLEVLNREASKYLASRSFPYRAVPIEAPARASFALRNLGPGEAALMRETAAFRDHVKEEERPAWLAEFRAKAARFPNDPFVLRMLSDAEFVAEDYPAARATADRLLAVSPDDVRGLTRKGMILLKEAEDLQGAELGRKVGEARKLILAANKKDPNDPHALVAYYQSFRVSGERAPAVAVEGLRQAVGTIPQDGMPRMLLATQLANEGKFAEAIHFLGPIAYDPHPSEGQAAALAFIQQLRQAMAAPKKP
jgi:tetratricopeptide (TPR) repeat protein